MENALGETVWQPSALVLPHAPRGSRRMLGAATPLGDRPLGNALGETVWQPSQRLRCHALQAAAASVALARGRGGCHMEKRTV